MRHCEVHRENYLNVCFGCLHDQTVADLTAVGFVVMSADELRARDDAIIKAALDWDSWDPSYSGPTPDFDAIIAAAEQETP